MVFSFLKMRGFDAAGWYCLVCKDPVRAVFCFENGTQAIGVNH